MGKSGLTKNLYNYNPFIFLNPHINNQRTPYPKQGMEQKLLCNNTAGI